MSTNANYAEIAKEYIKKYYELYDVDNIEQRVAGLNNLYKDPHSFMSFEGQAALGRAAISELLLKQDITKIERWILDIQSQPLLYGSVLAVVRGMIKTDENPPKSYSHVLIFRPNDDGSFYVGHEIYKLFRWLDFEFLIIQNFRFAFL